MNNYLELAEPYYSTNPDHFHTYEHAKIVINNAKWIIQKLGLEGLEESVDFSSAFHDVGYHHLEANKFTNKEDYSIHIMKQVAQQYDISDKILAGAIEGVEGTKINQSDFKSDMRKILRAADINNLGHSYENMLLDALKIYHEYSDLNKESLKESKLYPLPRGLFQQKQSEILKEILEKTQAGIPEKYFLHNNFYKRMEENIDKLSQEANPF